MPSHRRARKAISQSPQPAGAREERAGLTGRRDLAEWPACAEGHPAQSFSDVLQDAVTVDGTFDGQPELL